MVKPLRFTKNVSKACGVKLFGVKKPRYLWLETSTFCNSRCGTCNIWQNTKSENFDFELLADPLFQDVEYVINSGGEPSLIDLKNALLAEHKFLPKAVLQVSTNGLLPEKIFEAVKAAVDVGACVEVGISLDGVGEHHDKIRGVKGNFAKVESLLGLLKDLPVKVTVGSTLTDETYENKTELLAYAKSKSVSFMWHWFNSGSFYDNKARVFDNKKLNDALSIMPDGLYKEMWLANRPCFECFALRSFCVLKANGDVSPCLSRWGECIGNFKQQPISEIWNNAQAEAERDIVKACSGCLNSWGVGWSLQTKYFPNLKYKIQEKLK